MISTLAHQQQSFAAFGLVHHMAGDQHAGALVGESMEEPPQVLAQHRVQPDGRLVQHEQVRLLDQGDRETHP